MQKPPGGVPDFRGILFNFTWENKIQKNISFPYLLLESVTSRLHYNIK